MSKDVKSSTVLSQGMRGQTVASKPRLDSKEYVVVPRQSLSTDAIPPSPPSGPTSADIQLPPQLASLTDEQRYAFLTGKSTAGGITTKRKHFIGAGLSSTVGDVAATVANLISFIPASGVTPGDEPYSRLGNSILIKRCTLRWQMDWLYSQATSTVQANAYDLLIPPVRMMVYVDKMPLVGTTIAGTTTYPPNNPNALLFGNPLPTSQLTNWQYNPITHGTRYDILHNEVIKPEAFPSFALEAGATAGAATIISGAITRSGEINIPLELAQQFYGPLATNPLTNQLEMMVIADAQRVAAPTQPVLITWAYGVDITFEDLLN